MQEANERAIREYERLVERIAALGQTLGQARELTTILRALREFAVVSLPDGLVISLYEPDDWMMPGIEGPEICRRVRREIKTAPTYIILLTALREKEQMVAGLEAGADDYLRKPFDRHELRVRLQAGARIVELQGSLASECKNSKLPLLSASGRRTLYAIFR